MTKEDLTLNSNQKAVDYTYIETGLGKDNFPTFEIEYINPPKEFKLIKLIEPLKVAILEDLTSAEPI